MLSVERAAPDITSVPFLLVSSSAWQIVGMTKCICHALRLVQPDPLPQKARELEERAHRGPVLLECTIINCISAVIVWIPCYMVNSGLC